MHFFSITLSTNLIMICNDCFCILNFDEKELNLIMHLGMIAIIKLKLPP